MWIDPKFQSTPPHGRRRRDTTRWPACRGFQSTPPHGRRPPQLERALMRNDVSIHASAREATKQASHTESAFKSFNPRLRTGGDGSSRGNTTQNKSFNPRLRTGGDCLDIYRSHVCRSFNPRLRTGGDSACRVEIRHDQRFNPRLRTGGDKPVLKAMVELIVSIHASAREATLPQPHQTRPAMVSIHASAREATQTPAAEGYLDRVSIHASAREAT